MNQTTKDYLQLHLIVVIWGFTAIFGKLISLPPVELVFFRTLLAVLALFVILKWKKISFVIKGKRDRSKIAFVGLLIAAHWVLFFLSARMANVSVSLAGMATASIWTGFLEPLSTKSRIRPYELVISSIAFVGMILIFSSELAFGEAFVVAIFSAMLASAFSVINAGLTRRQDPLTLTFYEMGVSTTLLLLFFPFYQLWIADQPLVLIPRQEDWVFLILLSWICTVYAFSKSVELMRRLSAFSVNLSINLEPVYGILLALAIFGQHESMSGGFYLGGTLIILSVMVYPLLNRRLKRKPLEADLMR